MLEYHKKLLYPSDGKKKLGTTLELLKWKAQNGVYIWTITEDPKKDAAKA